MGRSLPTTAPTPQLVKQCNEGAHSMERMEQLCMLQSQLDFGKVKVGAPPLSILLSLLPPAQVSLPGSGVSAPWQAWGLGLGPSCGGTAASRCLTGLPWTTNPALGSEVSRLLQSSSSQGWRAGPKFMPVPTAALACPLCPPVPATHLELTLAAEARRALGGGGGWAPEEARQPALTPPVRLQ